MDPLFWILAGIVVGCVIGIVIIWRLEVLAERQAADNRKIEAEVSARLKIFDPRAAVEEIDTRPIPTAAQPDTPARAGRAPNGSEGAGTMSARGPLPARGQTAPAADTHSSEAGAAAPPERPLHWIPATAPAVNGTGQEHRTVERPLPPEVLQATPEQARARAAELGRERRYLEQAIEEQQARLEQLLLGDTADDTAKAATSLLRQELAQQRHHLEEISFLEECYRQVAVPSLEQLAQHYKQAASPHAPRAFGVRRHSLSRIPPPGKNPPAPPAQATTDSPA